MNNDGGKKISLQKKLKFLECDMKKCMYVILKYVLEEKLNYSRENIKNVKIEELKKYKFLFDKRYNYVIPSFAKKIQIEDYINFIYKDVYTEQELVRNAYIKSLEQGEELNEGVIAFVKDKHTYLNPNCQHNFYVMLETALELAGIDVGNDEEIFETITIEFLERYKLKHHYRMLYSNFTEMYYDIFGIDLSTIDKVEEEEKKYIKKEDLKIKSKLKNKNNINIAIKQAQAQVSFF